MTDPWSLLPWPSAAIYDWPQPGGLANRHDDSASAGHLLGVGGMCYPPCRHLLAVQRGCLHESHRWEWRKSSGDKQQLLLSSLLFSTAQRSSLGLRGAAVIPDVPTAVPGAQGHPAAQQGALECLLQEHRLAEQHQLHLPLCTQGAHEQISRENAALFHPVFLADGILAAHTLREVQAEVKFTIICLKKCKPMRPHTLKTKCFSSLLYSVNSLYESAAVHCGSAY